MELYVDKMSIRILVYLSLRNQVPQKVVSSLLKIRIKCRVLIPYYLQISRSIYNKVFSFADSSLQDNIAFSHLFDTILWRLILISCIVHQQAVLFVAHLTLTQLNIFLFKVTIETLGMVTVCSYHPTYAFENESTLYSWLNIKEFLARNRHEL